MSKGDWEGLSMQVSLEYHPYKIFIGTGELSGQAMGGFENLIAPCVGKSIEQGILFLVELSGMQPDSNSSTAQISLLLHVRAAEIFATMEPNNQAKVSGRKISLSFQMQMFVLYILAQVDTVQNVQVL